VLDPDAEWTFDRHSSASKSINSPFYGWTLRGRATATIVNGRKVELPKPETVAA
jgi:dihydroorotase